MNFAGLKWPIKGKHDGALPASGDLVSLQEEVTGETSEEMFERFQMFTKGLKGYKPYKKNEKPGGEKDFLYF